MIKIPRKTKKRKTEIEELKENNPFVILLLVTFLLVWIFADLGEGVKEPINEYHVIHFLMGMAVGAVVNNFFIFVIASFVLEFLEILVCVPLNVCYPPEYTLDTIFDIITNIGGYLVGLYLFRPKKKSFEENMRILFIIFILMIIGAIILGNISFLVRNG